jgi:hypothetical protein
MLAARFLPKSAKSTLLLKGVDLSDFVDGDTIGLKRIMKVTGVETYTAVSGASKTVRTLEPVLPDVEDKILKRIAEMKNEPKRAEVAERKATGEKAKTVRAVRVVDEEGTAAQKLKLAKKLVTSNPERAKQRLTEIVEQFRTTEAAKEANELLGQLGEK